MKVTFYSGFSKRFNSTKRPTGGVTKSVTLKDKTSLRNPSFKVEDDGKDYNYCSVGILYYYVTDKIYYPNKVIEYVCTLDILATNKDAIASLNCYIDRCSQSSPNLYIKDNFNETTDEKGCVKIETGLKVSSEGTSGNTTYGYIIIATGSNGPVAYYLTPTMASNLYKILQDRSGSTQEQEQKNVMNEAIQTMIRVPFSYGSEARATDINLAGYDTGINGWAYPIGANRKNSVTISSQYLKFPNSVLWGGTNNSYLDFSPYVMGFIYLPFVGFVPIDTDVIGSSKNLFVEYSIDLYTSDILWELGYYPKSGSYTKLASYSGKCGSTVPISTYQNDAWGKLEAKLQIIGGIADTAASAAMGLAFPSLRGNNSYVGAVVASSGSGLLSNLIENTYKYQKASEIHTTMNGATSSCLGVNLGTEVIVYLIGKKPLYANATEPNEVYGMPFNKIGTINDITGTGNYIKTKNCNFIGGAFDTNNETRVLLDQGIYYE